MHTGPNIKRDGLVFGYDTGQFASTNPNFDKFKPVKGRNRFYKGKSSVNYIAFQNPRIDSSYSSYTRGTGTWDSRHPDAITVYSQNGSNLSNYVNTGVGDWSNTDHAHWQFDRQLKKPVVVMHDITGSWKAKSFGAAMGAWANLGMSAGSQYTISWLQWVDNLSKYANSAFYSQNTSNTWGFHDGMTNGRTTALNTKLRTWQRVYATFTVSPSRNLSNSNGNVYMYGHYATRGTVKIADVQLELNDHPTTYQEFDGSDTYKQVRSSTEGVIDLTKNVNIDTSNVSFDTNGFLTFDGTDDYILGTIPSSTFSGAHSIGCWFYRETVTQWAGLFSNNVNTTSCSILTFISTSNSLGTNQAGVNGASISVDLGADHLNKWIYAVITYAGVTSGSTVNVYAYKNGSLLTASGSLYWNLSSSSSYYIGRHWTSASQILDGYIPVAKVYNRALSAQEVQQNYRAYKNRFNI